MLTLNWHFVTAGYCKLHFETAYSYRYLHASYRVSFNSLIIFQTRHAVLGKLKKVS